MEQFYSAVVKQSLLVIIIIIMLNTNTLGWF